MKNRCFVCQTNRAVNKGRCETCAKYRARHARAMVDGVCSLCGSTDPLHERPRHLHERQGELNERQLAREAS